MSEHDALDDLLRHAQPRPVPAPEDMAAVKAVVRDDWEAMTGRRVVRRRFMQFAIAATVVLGTFVALNVSQRASEGTITVATIAKSTGPIYLLGESAELRPTDNTDTVMAGQTIVTGVDAGLALAWGNGGSIRIDEGTRVRFDSNELLFVEQGRVYVDSRGSFIEGTHPENEAKLAILTRFGEIQHLGTQYMAAVDQGKGALIVSVREGRVAVDGRFYDETIVAGQQGTWAGQQRPSVLSISSAGPAWDWVGRTTPPVDADGKTLYQFLTWVCREMGLELRFEGQTEHIAHDAILKGSIDTSPAEALRLRLATAALKSRIEGDVIYISTE